jgi:hypothetical protein
VPQRHDAHHRDERYVQDSARRTLVGSDQEISSGCCGSVDAAWQHGAVEVAGRLLWIGASAVDRRVVLASLTPAGREKIEQAAAVHARDLEEVFAVFTVDERRELDRLLDRLRAEARGIVLQTCID